MNQTLYQISIIAIPAIIAITLHEAAHGFVAWRLGDDTAKVMGRVTFNPLRHVDPFGTIILPALLILSRIGFVFGWAKPVPVDFMRLNNPRRDMVLVAAAGPGINILIAILSALLIHLSMLIPGAAGQWLTFNLISSVQVNLILAVFNMIPIPPLDGGRVAVGLLPRSLARPLARLERFGLFIIIGVLFLLPWIGGRLGFDLDVLPWVLGVPVEFLLKVVSIITGNG
jgi:Zn-dependent protease